MDEAYTAKKMGSAFSLVLVKFAHQVLSSQNTFIFFILQLKISDGRNAMIFIKSE